MLSQITTTTSTEKWAAIAGIAGVVAVAAKKFFGHKPNPKPDYITRAEFHRELTAIRDRIGASYIAVAEKLDQNHKELLTRITELETGLARVDERTKK
jgi:hypothetical protein